MNLRESAAKRYQDVLARARDGGEKEFRRRAWDAFSRLGLPDPRNEDWKYTSLAEVTRASWAAPAPGDQMPSAVRELIREWKSDFDFAVLLNGRWQTKASLLTLESGCEFGAASDVGPVSFDDGFVSLAAAVSGGGYRLSLAPGVRLARPICLVHAQSGAETWNSTVNAIEIGADASADIVEIWLGETSRYLRTGLTNVNLQSGARLNWLRVQQDSAHAFHADEVQCRLASGAGLNLTQMNAGGSWSRTSHKLSIDGEGAEVNVFGLSFGRDSQHVDQRVLVRHNRGFSRSSQLFKGVLRDRSRGVLNGKIYIAQDAQKVSSNQLNHNLLLSPGAEADTKPELEIYADDVKANHGASIGRLDQAKLFYLMSRAIPRAEAERMLAHAFVSDVVLKVESAALRSFLDSRVRGILPLFMAVNP